MADTIIQANCGFFDSIDSDRVYTADDMNKPYKRIVSDGVFPTKANGDRSDDLKVVTVAGDSLRVWVKAGQALFNGKWFELAEDTAIDVPSNSTLSNRIDAVLLQINKTEEGRSGNIVYRTGTTSAPSYNTETNVHEYPLAFVTVPSGATLASQLTITDKRGTSECPWVRGLVYPDSNVVINLSQLGLGSTASLSDVWSALAASQSAFLPASVITDYKPSNNAMIYLAKGESDHGAILYYPDTGEVLKKDIVSNTPANGWRALTDGNVLETMDFVYLNKSTGNDNNDGSESHPFKTLDKALKYFSERNSADVRIRFTDTTGTVTYTWPAAYTTLTGGTLHLKSTGGANIVVDFTASMANDNFAFYGMHFNVTSAAGTIKLKSTAAKKFYFEGCSLWIENAVIDQADDTVIYGGNVYAEYLTVNDRFKLLMCNGYLKGCKFTYDETNEPPILIRGGSSVSFNDSIGFSDDDSASSGCDIQVDYSSVFFEAGISLSSSGTPYSNFMSTHGAFIVATHADLKRLEDSFSPDGESEIFNTVINGNYVRTGTTVKVTEWHTLTLANGVTAVASDGSSVPQWRQIEDRVEIRGACSLSYSGQAKLASGLPAPSNTVYWLADVQDLANTSISRLYVNSLGELYVGYVRQLSDGTSPTGTTPTIMLRQSYST